MMTACIFSYSMMLRIMDESGDIMTENQANRFHRFSLKHLQCWAWLRSYGMRAPLRTVGRRSWQLMPKLHHLWHLAHDVKKERLNPRMVMLLNAESFVGVMGRIGRATHRRTVSVRSLERYKASMMKEIRDRNIEKPRQERRPCPNVPRD